MSSEVPPPPKIRGKWLLFAGVTILAAVAAGSIAVWRQQMKPKPAAVQAPKPAADEWTAPEVSLTGRIQAQKVIPVPVPIEGTIEAFHVEVDQDVFEGQLLARIHNTKLAANLEQTTAEMEQAQTRVQNTEASITAARLEASRAAADASRSSSEYDRAEKTWQRQQMLYREGATARLAYEKAERDYTALKEERENKSTLARQMDERVQGLNRDLDVYRRMLDQRSQSLEHAKADVAAAEVHSPVDGVVVARRGEPGEDVTPDITDLFQVATELSSLEIILNPTPAQLKRIRPGQPVSIHVAEMPGESLQGTVKAVSGGQAIVEFASPSTLIKPGLSAQVTIKLT